MHFHAYKRRAWPSGQAACLARRKSRVRLHWGHMSKQFFRSNRPRYPQPYCSELENSGIRVAVGDCSVTERQRWRKPYQTGKAVHVHAKHYKHNVDGCTAPGVCGNGSVPLSHSGNVVTRIGIHTHTFMHFSHFFKVEQSLWFLCFASLTRGLLLEERICSSSSKFFLLDLATIKNRGKTKIVASSKCTLWWQASSKSPIIL